MEQVLDLADRCLPGVNRRIEPDIAGLRFVV